MYREQFGECAYWCQDLKTMFFQHDFELLIFLNKTKFIQSIYLKEKKLLCHYYLRPVILERASVEYLAKTWTLSWKLTNFNFFFWSADSDQEEDTNGRRSPKPRQRSRSLRWVTCVIFYLDENECPLKFERSRVVLGLKTFEIFR